jgi:hypothetical protein
MFARKIRMIMEERRNLPTVKKERQSMEKAAHISTEIFVYGRTRWRMKVRPFRLLMMVCQAISSEKGQLPIFPEYVFPLGKVFTYLGLEKTKGRYDLLAEDLREFLSSCVEIKSYTKRGAQRWTGTSFITWYLLDEEESVLNIQINEKARDYLFGMNRWCSMQPKFYLRLSTEYQNWFYTFLRKELNFKPKITVEISVLKEMLYLDKTPSYNTTKNPNANDNFFKRVIGIRKPKDWKYTPKGKNTPWEYTKDSKGEYTGALAGITMHTDMNVTAYPVKTGRSYTAIIFEISSKAKVLTEATKVRVRKESSKHDIQDMGKPTRQGRSKKLQTIADLFQTTPVVQKEKNPIMEKEQIPTGSVIIHNSTVLELARAQGINAESLAERLGYKRRKDGDWERSSY